MRQGLHHNSQKALYSGTKHIMRKSVSWKRRKKGTCDSLQAARLPQRWGRSFSWWLAVMRLSLSLNLFSLSLSLSLPLPFFLSSSLSLSLFLPLSLSLSFSLPPSRSLTLTAGMMESPHLLLLFQGPAVLICTELCQRSSANGRMICWHHGQVSISKTCSSTEIQS